MKKDELIAVATMEKLKINDQIEAFIESVDRGTVNPDDFVSFTQY